MDDRRCQGDRGGNAVQDIPLSNILFNYIYIASEISKAQAWMKKNSNNKNNPLIKERIKKKSFLRKICPDAVPRYHTW